MNKKIRQLIAVFLTLSLLGVEITSCGKENTADKDISETNKVTEELPNETTVTEVDRIEETIEESAISTTENIDIPSETSSSNIISNTTQVNATGTINGTGYEGIEGTGKYNYGEALQKSLMFYELQRSGILPEQTRCNWRGNSCINDGRSEGLDLSGGWYDAGDNVKFNLPMAYTASVLSWSVYETPLAYEESGQLQYALDNIRWANEYFIKCHPEDEVYYYQVGDGNQDHSWWGPCEVLEYEMNRPCYRVDSNNPGSTVTGEAAASLALCAIIFENVDKDFAEECREHAISLFDFAEKYKSDSGYTAANGFYNSWSGFNDELSWASCWLYVLTEDEAYLNKAKNYYDLSGHDANWAFCWDDVHIGAALMLSEFTGEAKYTNDVEEHLNFWVNDITYSPKGLAWLDGWGSLRYATTTAFIAEVYANGSCCSSDKATIYKDFALSQANYALGDGGRSYMIGFGENYPKHPHHRTSQGSYSDNMNEPGEARHILCGALVGGPDMNDGYTDEVANYNTNEVACDYNAGFTGLLAFLYQDYHGKTITDFGCCEEVTIDEFSCEASINAEGNGFTEFKAVVYNKTSWPARAPENFELRYFVDLSEIIDAGFNSSDITFTTNYMQDAYVNGLGLWDEENNIYYLSVGFSQDKFYPGGQSEYKKEIQVRLSGPEGSWNPANDPSYQGLQTGSLSINNNICLYENGILVFGTEPSGDGITTDNLIIPDNSGEITPSVTPDSTVSNTSGSVTEGDLIITVNYNNNGSLTNAIAGELRITNNGSEVIPVSSLSILYYFTNDNSKTMDFACYHSAVQGANGSYRQLTSVSGEFSKESFTNADTLCKISYGDSENLNNGDYLVLSFSINCSDWSDMNMSNDYSYMDVNNIVILSGDNVIAGNMPQ